MCNIILYNKSVQYKYLVEKELNAGISLLGWEVKSIRSKSIDIRNSYVIIKNKEAYLIGVNFQKSAKISSNVKINRNIKLLLNKKELFYLSSKINLKGYTVVLISIYTKHAWIKAKIGISKGKKLFNKRKLLLHKEWQKQKRLFYK